MPKRGENIRKRKDNRWEGRYIIGYDNCGKACYRSIYGKTYQEVKTKLSREKEYAVYPKSLSRNQSLSLEEVLYCWMDKIKISVKPSTYVRYHTLINNQIIPVIGKKKMYQVNTEMVQTFLSDKLHPGKEQTGLSVGTVRLMLYIIKASQQWASQQGLCPEHHFHISLPIIQKQIQVFSKDEQSKLEHYLLEHLCPQVIGILLCLYTGIRLGEICGLLWDDIDLKNQTIKIERTVQRIPCMDSSLENKTYLYVGPTKSVHSNRLIPIPSFLFPILSMSQGTGYVLTNDKNRLMEPRSYQRVYKLYLEKAGLDDTNFHILRHTFATRSIEAGVDPKTLSQILGHSSVNITMNLYVHPTMETKRLQMELLNSVWGQKNGQYIEIMKD